MKRRFPKPRAWIPKNTEKYAGDPTKIVSRSSWELRTFKWLDENPSVLEWSSEEIVIPYKSPVDNKIHRYFPDVYARFKTSDNRTKTYLIEIKPEYQVKPPEIKKNITKRYVTEVCTYAVNDAKWRAAREYCLDRKWEFKVITEKDLFTK